jgi:hypothetical protein
MAAVRRARSVPGRQAVLRGIGSSRHDAVAAGWLFEASDAPFGADRVEVLDSGRRAQHRADS